MAVGAVKLWSEMGVIWEDIAYGNGYEVEFIVTALSALEEVELKGLNIYPNPATDYLTVAFDLPKSTELGVGVFNMMGQQVMNLGTNNFAAGSNNLEVNTSDLSSGVYFISINEGEKITSRKISIIK